jgi:hypothetical protein
MSRFPRRFDDYIALLIEEEQMTNVKRTMELAASSDPDILYLHEALAADDRKEFIKAMQRKVQTHVDNKN